MAETQRAAEPVFAQWVKDLEVYKNQDLRERSRVRLDETRRRYDKMVATVEAARAEYEALNESLRDYALYLGNDFNSASVADIRPEVGALTEQTKSLSGRLDECLVVTRSYIDNAALPGRPASDGGANQVQSAERVQPVAGGK